VYAAVESLQVDITVTVLGCFNFVRVLCAESYIQSQVTTNGQSVSPSWCRAPSGAHDQILLTV
jgi:hypothetical protein